MNFTNCATKKTVELLVKQFKSNTQTSRIFRYLKNEIEYTNKEIKYKNISVTCGLSFFIVTVLY